MMVDLFYTLIYIPLYNALVGIVSFMPEAELGIAIILLTFFVKILILPLTLKASRVQKIVREMQPALDALKKEYKDDRQTLAIKTMDLYREYKINPFTFFIPLLVQFPVIFGLFFVFSRGGLPNIDTNILYSFIPIPENINMFFLGFIDLGAKSAPLALLTGLTTYMQMHIVMPKIEVRSKDATFKQDFQRSLNIQMRYVFPVAMAGFSYFLPGAVALYWIISNLFQIAQEKYVRRDNINNVKDTKNVEYIEEKKDEHSLEHNSQGSTFSPVEQSGNVIENTSGKKFKKHKKIHKHKKR